MRKRIFASLGAAVVTLGLFGACAPDDALTGAPLVPGDAPALARTRGKPKAQWHAAALTRNEPLASDLTVSRVIGPEGGTIEIRAAGLRVDVPAGAVRSTATFSVTAVAGAIIAYDFAPEGAIFTVPLLVSQSVRGTSWERLGKAGRDAVEAGYFTDRSMLGHADSTALIAERLATAAAWSGNEIQFPVHHFSGYMYSWGRTRVPQ
jgi:hypothetical protein